MKTPSECGPFILDVRADGTGLPLLHPPLPHRRVLPPLQEGPHPARLAQPPLPLPNRVSRLVLSMSKDPSHLRQRPRLLMEPVRPLMLDTLV